MKKPNKKTATTEYILTLTLYEHLSALKRVGLKIPSRAFVEAIEGSLDGLIRESIDGKRISEKMVVVKTIPFGDFCDEIVSSATSLKNSMPDAIVVSTTPMIVYDAHGICFGLSRLIDMAGNMIAIGARPSYGSIEHQIEKVLSTLKGHRVIIMEDGSFTGKTLCFMLERLAACGIDIAAVVMGILFPEARVRLSKTFNGRIICKHNFADPLDWMPSHDFFPFIPNSGRVIGTKVGESLIPVHLSDQSTLSKPYILPYGQLDKWSGLPLSPTAQVEFSRFCLTRTMEIFQEMEHLNGRVIKVGDIVRTNPVTSVPVPDHQRKVEFFNLNQRVIDILNRDYESVG